MSQELAKIIKSAVPTRFHPVLESISSGWQAQEKATRQKMLISTVIAVAVMAAVAWWSMQPDWKTLYTGLSPDNSRELGSLLTTASIRYETLNDGATIRVASENLDKARLATAGKATGKSARLGYEIFDKPNWAGSDFDDKVNYQRALEGELEHTIDTMDSVESSRVHLVLPHDSLFTDLQRDAKASVVLHLKTKNLTEAEADSIRSLVASSVDDLSPDHVALVSADGHSPLGSRSSASDMAAAYEQQLTDHVLRTLEPVTGEGNVRVTVEADFDSSSSDEVDEKYDPAGVVTLSMQRSEESAGLAPQPAGVPGTASNAPNQQLPLYPSKQPTTQSTKQESGTYGASKSTLHHVQGPGKLRRITAAVVVNDKPASVSGNKDSGRSEPWTPEEMKKLTLLVEASVGYDATRGDQVVLQNLTFKSVPEPRRGAIDKVRRNIGVFSVIFRYLALMSVAGIAIFAAFKSLKVVTSTLASARPRSEIHAGAAGVEIPHQFDVTYNRGQLLEQVTEHVHRDPAQSARILQTWMRSD